MSVGDYVEIEVDLGGGASRQYKVMARARGRRIEVRQSSKAIEVEEVTKGGTVIRKVTVMPSRVLAMDEHYNDTPEEAEGEAPEVIQPGLALAAEG